MDFVSEETMEDIILQVHKTTVEHAIRIVRESGDVGLYLGLSPKEILESISHEIQTSPMELDLFFQMMHVTGKTSEERIEC